MFKVQGFKLNFGENEIRLPSGTRILSIGFTGGVLGFWAWVDDAREPNTRFRITVLRTDEVFGTSGAKVFLSDNFIGTAIDPSPDKHGATVVAHGFWELV